jgi:hypothetical protein
MMSDIDLKEKLIVKIQEMDNHDLLAEAYRLLGLEVEGEEPFKLDESQKGAIIEARNQIKNGQSFTNAEADNEIDEWLKM